jgi:hypothetical protein
MSGDYVVLNHNRFLPDPNTVTREVLQPLKLIDYADFFLQHLEIN